MFLALISPNFVFKQSYRNTILLEFLQTWVIWNSSCCCFNKKLFLIRFYCLCGSFQFENENVSSEMKSSAECLLGRDFDRREITFQFGFLVKMFSNAKLRKQTTFLKFSLYLYFCFSICVVMWCSDEKYMALTATYSHSSLIVFLSHNIIGLYF